MSAAFAGMPDRAAAAARTGYRPQYQSGLSCPACGWGAWYIGRSSAECARCATALPLAPRPASVAVTRYTDEQEGDACRA